MFDIGFLEILVILIVALVVIGPERMPEVARKIGSFTGKTKRFIQNMKEDSQLHDTVRELKESMDLQEEKKHLDEISASLNSDFSDISQDLDLSEFQRPTFGGEAPADSRSQYNKAPQQPVLPTAEKKEVSQTAATSPQTPVTTASQTLTQTASNQTATKEVSTS